MPICFIIWEEKQWALWTLGLCGIDEVAGIHFKDKDGIQIMKDYMLPALLPVERRKGSFRVYGFRGKY